MKQIKLYIMSLWILFFLLFVKTIDVPCYFGADAEFVGFNTLFTPNNCIAVLSITGLIFGICFHSKFNHILKGSIDNSTQAKNVQNVNFEYFSFLMTLLTIFAIDYKDVRGVVLFIILLIIMGIIFCKTELFYNNPAFAILGYHLYKINVDKSDNKNPNLPKEFILISKCEIQEGKSFSYIKISNSVYYHIP